MRRGAARRRSAAGLGVGEARVELVVERDFAAKGGPPFASLSLMPESVGSDCALAGVRCLGERFRASRETHLKRRTLLEERFRADSAVFLYGVSCQFRDIVHRREYCWRHGRR